MQSKQNPPRLWHRIKCFTVAFAHTVTADLPETPEVREMRRASRQLLLAALLVGIGLVLLVVLPSMPRVRPVAQQRACITNLKQIDSAVQGWALYANKSPTNAYSLGDTDILRFLKGSVLPACPAGGVYHAGRTVSEVPRCTIPGHTL